MYNPLSCTTTVRGCRCQNAPPIVFSSNRLTHINVTALVDLNLAKRPQKLFLTVLKVYLRLKKYSLCYYITYSVSMTRKVAFIGKKIVCNPHAYVAQLSFKKPYKDFAVTDKFSATFARNSSRYFIKTKQPQIHHTTLENHT